MVVSKSGSIRRTLGPRKKRLKDLLATADTALQIKSFSDDATKQEFIDNSDILISKLETVIKIVEDADKQWLDLIQTLPELEIPAEEGLYEAWAIGDDNDEGHVTVMDRAKESISLLRLKVDRLRTIATETVTNQPQQPLQHLVTGSSSSQQNVTTAPAARPGARKSAKLPKLTLPFFEGDPLAWEQFHSIFKTNIDESELEGAEKLVYLRGQLKGNAIDSIEGLPITNEGYVMAMDILKERYKRSPEQLVSSLYSQLKRLPRSADRVEDLRRTYDACEKIFRQLRGIGENIDSNRSLTMDVWSKYPVSVVKEMAKRKCATTHSSLSEVQKALKEYIDETDDLRDMIGDLEPFNNKESGSKPKFKHDSSSSVNSGSNEVSTPLNSALATCEKQQPSKPQQRSEAKKPQFPCCFCKEIHFNSECPKFPTRDQRVARLEVINRCQRCLGTRHRTAECDSGRDRVRCYYCKTSGEHISALCPKQFSSVSATDVPQATQQSTSTSNSNTGSCGTSGSKTSCGLSFNEQSLLSTAVAVITNPETGQQDRVKIILDSGSHRSYVTEALSTRLGLSSIKTEMLTVAVFGSDRSLSVPSSQVGIAVTLKDGRRAPLTVHTTPVITNCSLSMDVVPEVVREFVASIKHSLADDGSVDGPPDLLVGSDYFWEFVSGSLMKTNDGIVVIPTSLGLVLGGRFRDDSESVRIEHPALLCLTERTTPALNNQGMSLISAESRSVTTPPDTSDFWSLEKIGICDDPTENDDELALKAFNKSVYLEDGRYYVYWPWKEANFRLMSNYQLAMGRLKSLAKRLTDSDGKLAAEYDNVIKTQVKLGIIEKVPKEEISMTSSLVHYLPHHPVVRENKTTTKVRIVYDASAKCRKDQSSLNECMYRGPVLLPDLCSILFRFRTYKVAITSDIEKAFLQVGLAPSQRDVTRFLWFNDPQDPNPDDVSIFRFARVPFGVISSPFLLGATVQFHLHSVNTETSNHIADNIYVDNGACGAEDDDDAIRFYDEAKHIFNKASMNLREWNSNSKTLREYIPVEDHDPSTVTSVLGIKWDVEADMMGLKGNWNALRTCTTKREVLQATSSVYDPLGWFQPCTLLLKLFLREVWELKLNWDQVIDVTLQDKWSMLHDDIGPIFDIRLPRHTVYTPQTTLVAFSDASADAYAVAVYLRTPANDGTWRSNLVFSKSRLSPKSCSKKKTDVSIPKLELLGLLIAARATEFLRASLNKPGIKAYLFCDSICVLRWLQSAKPLPVFVANRVREIKSIKHVEFRHVDSHDNPADLCTRGTSGSAIAESRLWWRGPQWLEGSSDEWKTGSNFEALTDEIINSREDVQSQPVFHTLVAGEHADVGPQYPPGSMGINPARYSTFLQLIRVTCWVRRALRVLVFNRLDENGRNRHAAFGGWLEGVSEETYLTSVELEKARKLWIGMIQHDAFGKIFDTIDSRKPHHLINQLNLQIHDDGLLRSHSRMAFAELPDDVRVPILLPYDNRVTRLIISDIHGKLLHPGISHTLNQVRRVYWVPRGRNTVKKVITRCQFCRKAKGRPYALPNMPAWPAERVSRSAPFQFTGVDYFGPVNVVLDKTTHKMWVCLFTCLTVRAVHLELVFNCTAEAFINAISRFISRRGAPERMLSDNAPQFRLAKTLFDRTWHQIFTDTSVQSYISSEGIQWDFTTELAPWQGGVYERMVGLVKNCYKNNVGRKLLKFEEFMTLLHEIESIVNSRPITYVYSDASSGLALRPVDFLADRSTGTPTIDPGLRPEGGDASRNLARYWKSKQRRLDLVWKQWYEDYLVSLRERGNPQHNCNRSDVKSTTPTADQVVIVKNEDCPRGMWKVARILRIIPGADGAVRSAELLLPNKQIIKRPINHLYSLEIPANEPPGPGHDDDGGTLHQPLIPVGADDEPFEGFTEEEVQQAEERTNQFGQDVNVRAQLFCGLVGSVGQLWTSCC